MKRLVAITLTLIMLAALIPAAHSEDAKPDGWWPALEAYTAAVGSGDADKILAAGDVNADGKVNAKDVTAVIKSLVGAN